MIITAGLLGGAATAGVLRRFGQTEDVEAKGALLRKAESAVESTSSWFGPSPPIKIDSGTKLARAFTTRRRDSLRARCGCSAWLQARLIN